MKLMSDSIGEVAKALVKAQKQMGNAVKDSKNPFFKSSYADLNAVREAVLPACNDNGISVLQSNIYFEGKKFVQTIALHESGEYISGITEILAVKETDAQAQGSGISYARRYGLQSLFNIGAEDDDGNSASGKTAAPIRPSLSAQNVAPSPVKEASGDQETKPAQQQAASNANKKSFRKPAPADTAGSEDL
jgi:hypothetical protein